MAGINACIIRRDAGPVQIYLVLGDRASALYAWRTIADVIGGLGGRPVGTSAIDQLMRG